MSGERDRGEGSGSGSAVGIGCAIAAAVALLLLLLVGAGGAVVYFRMREMQRAEMEARMRAEDERQLREMSAREQELIARELRAREQAELERAEAARAEAARAEAEGAEPAIEARAARARVPYDFKALADAIALFRLDCGRIPAQLAELWEPPANAARWNGPYLSRFPPRDPWGNDYLYQAGPGADYELISYGADGAPGGVGPDADLSSRSE